MRSFRWWCSECDAEWESYNDSPDSEWCYNIAGAPHDTNRLPEIIHTIEEIVVPAPEPDLDEEMRQEFYRTFFEAQVPITPSSDEDMGVVKTCHFCGDKILKHPLTFMWENETMYAYCDRSKESLPTHRPPTPRELEEKK